MKGKMWMDLHFTQVTADAIKTTSVLSEKYRLIYEDGKKEGRGIYTLARALSDSYYVNDIELKDADPLAAAIISAVLPYVDWLTVARMLAAYYSDMQE